MADAPGIAALASAVFGAGPDRDEGATERRIAHLLRTAHPSSRVGLDPADALAGACLVIERGPLVVLSLAVVREDLHGRGVGRALLASFPAAREGRARALLSSSDPRAMRRYAALGLGLRPAVSACGILRPGAVTTPPGAEAVRPLEGLAVLDAIASGPAARGVPYGADAAVWDEQGDTLHLVGDRAAAIRGGGVLRTVVARDEAAGRAVLQAALAAVPPGETVHLRHLREGQDWAVSEVLRAGLALSPEGPVFSDRPLGKFLLPSGALL